MHFTPSNFRVAPKSVPRLSKLAFYTLNYYNDVKFAPFVVVRHSFIVNLPKKMSFL